MAINGRTPYHSRTFQTQDELLAWTAEERTRTIGRIRPRQDLTPDERRIAIAELLADAFGEGARAMRAVLPELWCSPDLSFGRFLP